MKKKSQLISFIGLAFIFLFSTIILHIWQLSGVIIPLLIFFFFVLSSKEVTIEQVEINRQISRDRTEAKGELIYIRVNVRNNGERIPILEIVDKIPDECTVNEGSNHWLIELNQDEELTLTYSIQCHKRGRFTLGPVVIRGSDTFHFNSKEKEISVFDHITVVPSLIKLRELPIFRNKLLPETGCIPSMTYKGRDFDFQGVRDYQEGDEVRAINWRVTAKFNQLSTNEYAFDQSARIFIIFDHTTSTHHVLEEGVKAALSTSEYLISLRNKVGFYGIGEFINEISPAPGRRQLLRINEYLIDTKASYPSKEEILQLRLRKRLLPSLPPFAQIFLISPLYNRLMLDFLTKLVRNGHEITLIVPGLESIREKNPLNPKASYLANALLLLDRANTMKQVDQLGVMQIFWYPFGPKYELLKVRRTR